MFIKLPASELYDERYGQQGVFTVSMFMQRCTLKRQMCGLAIDCTSYDVEVRGLDRSDS